MSRYVTAAGARGSPLFAATAQAATVFDRILNTIAAWRREMRRRRRAHETVVALMALSSRELKDIGLSRSDILSVVAQDDSRRLAPYRD